MAALYLIEILHQTTTSSRARARLLCCILLKFYIKPQQPFTRSRYSKLYLIEILHQTTTCGKCEDCLRRLYLIEILHQTTTPALASMPLCRCILLKFYIKPQPAVANVAAANVVSYRNSTSNHNSSRDRICFRRVVSYRNSTSNHNSYVGRKASGPVVSYRNSTSNHNHVNVTFLCFWLYLIEILHQTTTCRR